jgi:transposase
MANQLKMAMIQAIIALLGRGWSYRRIARELGIHRETVARYARLNRERPAKPAISTPGTASGRASKPAISTPGTEAAGLGHGPPPDNRPPGRQSHCEPYAEYIHRKLDAGLSAQRIFQDLRSDREFTGSYSSVKRYVRRLGASTPLPFRRMECAPGAEAQVDFGTGPWVIEEGRRRHTHVFRVTLSHSRKSYSEAVFRQTTENFIRCLEGAFRLFGGVPATVVIDNLKAAVKNPDWFDPDLNPKITAFARHYGCAFLPTKPYTPRHKGKIENGIKYVKNNALKGRHLPTIAEVNRFLAYWERAIADNRIHGTTKKHVRSVFEAIERPALSRLPSDPFPFFHEARRKVHRDGHVEVAKAYYSAPPEYLGREVWVRYDTRLVRIYNDRFEQIATHGRAHPGRFRTDRRHIAPEKISAIEHGTDDLLAKASRIGPEADRWARAMISERGIEGIRVLQGFVMLAKKHPANVINRASHVALTGNLFRLRPVRELCKRLSQDDTPEFTTAHPIIRPLSEYQQLVLPLSPNEEGSDPS